MPTATEAPFAEIFDQAVQSYGEALKAGVKAQEQIASWWTDTLNAATPTGEWQRKQHAMLTDVIPAAQRNAEEWLKLAEQNYRRASELLKKAFDAGSTANVAELQNRTRQLWENSLQLVKDNTQAVAQTNVKVMELWADVLRQATATASAAAKSAGSEIPEPQ